jgi:AcrR family transcriptional regulator
MPAREQTFVAPSIRCAIGAARANIPAGWTRRLRIARIHTVVYGLDIISILQRQYNSVWKMPDNRLGPAEWVNAGLKALAKSGFSALKADTLANSLGVSRGSFYWHFADVSAFQAAILGRWREIALENIIAEIEGTADDRLEALVYRAFAADSGIERAVRAWATADAQARAAVEAVDVERIRYLRKLLIEAGVHQNVARTRARIMNWCYLGFALSSNKLDHDSLKHVIGDLSRLARFKLGQFPDDARAPRAARERRAAKPGYENRR